MQHGKVYYAHHKDVMVFKLVGDVRYAVSSSYAMLASFEAFLDRLVKESEFDHVLIDLTELTSIDSTNIGLLAKIAVHKHDTNSSKPTIISTNESITRLLYTMGLQSIFLIVDKVDIGDTEWEEIPTVDPRDRSLAKIMLEAHRTLSELSKENKETFRDVILLLEDKVSRTESR
jgi:anti-anti-sigma factor